MKKKKDQHTTKKEEDFNHNNEARQKLRSTERHTMVGTHNQPHSRVATARKYSLLRTSNLLEK